MRIALYDKFVRTGGVYTFDLNFVQTFGKSNEILYIYEGGDLDKLETIAAHATLVKNSGQEIDADICIYSSLSQAAHQIKAKKYVQMLHADYDHWNIKYKPVRIDCHVAVGESVKSSFKLLQPNTDVVAIPNIIVKPEVVRKALRLITVSRIDEGKGFDRLPIMAKFIKNAGIPFSWELYGEGPRNFIENLKYELAYLPEVVLMGARPHDQVLSYVMGADYVVQLSDSEGYCYSIHEALTVCTPVIVTDWEGVRESVRDGVNGYVVAKNLSGFDPHKIWHDIPRVSGYGPEVRNPILLWEKYFYIRP